MSSADYLDRLIEVREHLSEVRRLLRGMELTALIFILDRFVKRVDEEIETARRAVR